jgi:hypothetical protein
MVPLMGLKLRLEEVAATALLPESIPRKGMENLGITRSRGIVSKITAPLIAPKKERKCLRLIVIYVYILSILTISQFLKLFVMNLEELISCLKLAKLI